jgi:hypothetical protein
MERNELLEHLLELKGKTPLSAEDWKLLNLALSDPGLQHDRQLLELLDTLEDENRIQHSEEAAFQKFKTKINKPAGLNQAVKTVGPAKPKASWWQNLTKPRRPWGLPVVLAQCALLAVYLNVLPNQVSKPGEETVYRSAEPYKPCEVVRIVFKPETTIEQISDILKKANLKIVDGPTAGNEFVVLRGAFTEAEISQFFSETGTVESQVCPEPR